jgi:hypothetical protein
MGRPNRGLIVAVVVGVVVLVLITVLSLRGDTNRSTTGRVVEVDNRRICVAESNGDGRPCARVDRPPLVSGVRTGDCVAMRRSSDGILEEVAPAVDCRL